MKRLECNTWLVSIWKAQLSTTHFTDLLNGGNNGAASSDKDASVVGSFATDSSGADDLSVTSASGSSVSPSGLASSSGLLLSSCSPFSVTSPSLLLSSAFASVFSSTAD